VTRRSCAQCNKIQLEFLVVSTDFEFSSRGSEEVKASDYSGGEIERVGIKGMDGMVTS
jgi:hypothetical protein